jgi:hypothetical protein
VPSDEDPTTTPTTFPTPKGGHHVVALAVTLSVVGVLLIIGITFFAVRMRRVRSAQVQQLEEEEHTNSSARTSIALDPRHPASRIAPFSGEHLSFCGLQP